MVVTKTNGMKKSFFGLENCLTDIVTYPDKQLNKSISYISNNITGPYQVSSTDIICPNCDKRIGKNYLKQHQKSGACQRQIEKERKKVQYSF